MFSNCNECYICANSGGCLAGNGEDLFYIASKEKIIDNLNHGRFPDHEDKMIKILKSEYNYDYKKEDSDILLKDDLEEYEAISEDDINNLFNFL